MRNQGYSLLEIMLAMAILAIVSALSFVVLQGATETTALTTAKSEVQANLRDVMAAITSEVRSAYTDKTIATLDPQFLPIGVVAPAVSSGGKTLTFMVPIPSGAAITNSSLITYRFENEDGLNGGNVNGRLDDGEDADGDGLLNRRVIREQDGELQTIGSVNDLSDVRFALLPDATNNQFSTTLFIHVESSKGYGLTEDRVVRADSETTIHLQN